jgi:uncharacterized membrane protein
VRPSAVPVCSLTTTFTPVFCVQGGAADCASAVRTAPVSGVGAMAIGRIGRGSEAERP